MKWRIVIFILISGGLHADAQVQHSTRDSIAVKQFFFAGLRDKLNEDYNGSMINFNRVIAADPANAAAYYEIALINYRLDKMIEAEAAIKKAVTLEADNVWYWKLLAEVYKRNGNMDELIKVFDQLIARSPDEEAYYFDRSNALLLSGKKEEALAGYDKLEKKFGPSAALSQARARVAGNGSADTRVGPANTGDEITMATAYIAKRDFVAAAKELSNAAATHQNDPLFFALYGDVLFETGNLPAALKTYKQALELTDQLYGVWEKVLNIHILLEQYKQMIEMGEAAIAVYPNQAILYYYMAFALHRETRNEEALSYIRTALQLDGDNKSLQALIFALQAEILIDAHKLSAADIAFNRAVELDPENYQIINNYAYYLALRNENLAKAESLIAKAAQALPRDISIADTYALILFKLGRYAAAKTWIEKSLINNDADNSVYLEHYGDILFLIGEKEQALSQWQKSKAAGNDSTLLNRKINEKKYLK